MEETKTIRVFQGKALVSDNAYDTYVEGYNGLSGWSA